MRTLLVFAALASLVFSQSDDTKRIRVEGRVLSVTGEPVRKATVRLGPNVAQTTPINFQAFSLLTETTNDAGQFVFSDVKPGSYQVRAERVGFLPQVYGSKVVNSSGSALNLKEGDKLSGILIQMTPHGVIAGRVLDADGDPVTYTQVRAMRYSYQGGQRQLRNEGNGGVTDDQGNYRIAGLSPGRYYLRVEQSPTASATVATVTTYFPNSLDLRSAASVDVRPGEEQAGVTIRMRREKVFSIRGSVLDGETGQPQGSASVVILPSDGLMPDTNSARTMAVQTMAVQLMTPIPSRVQTGRDGKFVLPGLLPGTYTLVAGPGGGFGFGGAAGQESIRIGNGGLSARVETTVGNQDANADLTLSRGVTLPGRFVVEGGSMEDLFKSFPEVVRPPNFPEGARLLLPAPEVRVFAVEGLSVNVPTPRSERDGTFELKGTLPGRYTLSVGGLPVGYYVKAMRLGGQDLMRSALDVSSGGGGEVEIVLAKGTGGVSGSVANSQGQALGGASVSLWPRSQSSNLGEAVRTTVTDQGGVFQFTNVPPGDYLAAAFEDLPDAGLGQYPAFLTGFNGEAASVKLDVNGTASVSLKLISRDKVAAEVSKLP